MTFLLRARKRALAALAWLYAGDPVIATLLGILLVYYVATPGIFQGKASGDGLIDFLFLPSLLVHGTLDMTRAVAEAHFWTLPVMNGRMTNPMPIGPPIAWLPLYGLGLALEAALRPLGLLRATPFGVNPFAFWMCGLATLLAGAVGVRAMFLLVRRHLGVAAARLGVAGALFATPLVWHLVHQPMLQHGLSFATVALLVERWDAWRAAPSPRPTATARLRLAAEPGTRRVPKRYALHPTRRYALLGVIGGFGALVRQQELIFLALPGIDLAWAAVRALRAWQMPALRKACASGAALAGTALGLFFLQMAVWRYYYGSFGSPFVAVGYVRWGQPSIVGTLFAMRGGLLPWSPIVYLCLLGLLVNLGRLRWLGGALVALFAMDTYLNACIWDWWGSWSFAARRFCDCTVIFALGLAGLWTVLEQLGARARAQTQRALVACTVVLCLGNAVAMELVRARKTPSSAGVALGAWERLEGLGAPRPLVALLREIGWPPCWPASIPFALDHHAPVRSFEEIYGMYFNDRDYWDHTLWHSALTLAAPEMRRYLLAGFGPPERPSGAVPVQSSAEAPARVLIPLFRREALRVHVEGLALAGADGGAQARWNRAPVTVTPEPTGLSFVLEPNRVLHGVNELDLVLPPESRVRLLRFEPLEREVFAGPPWKRLR